MQIAFDAKRAFRNRRGLGNYSRDVIRLLSKYYPEHTYVLCGVPDSSFPFVPGGNTRVESPKGWWRWFPALWRSWGVTGSLDGVGIYHGLSGELPFGLRRKGIRSIVTVHDVIFIRYPHLYSATYRWLFRQKVQWACDHADGIIAISEQTKADVVRFFHTDERKIRVVYQGCHGIFREPVSDEQVRKVREEYGLPEHFIVSVGAIEERKNLLGLVRGVALMQKKMPVVAVGSHSRYADRVAEEAERLGVDLRMYHTMPFEIFPALYKAADVMVYPSVFEGFGIPILEAMCVGTPVVTSTGSCFAETGGEAALYADPEKPEQIAKQVERVVMDAELRERMVQKGYEQAQRFGDERVAEQLWQVYQEWM